MTTSTVIIGAGQAGVQVAASLRDMGYTGSVTLLGDEPQLPYPRPPLSKGHLMPTPAPLVPLRPAQFYRDHGIELLTGERATAIDRAGRTVMLAGGKALPYDHLVLATGGGNRRLGLEGEDLDGMLALRNLGEAERLREDMAAAARIVIIGGGYIGLEIASIALSRGIATCIVEAAPRLVARVASNELSEFFRRHYENAGARILCGTTVARIAGEGGRLASLTLSTGEVIETALALVCIGIAANVELAEAAGLETANGIVVDGFLRTRDERIFAIGDCACFPSRYAGGDAVRVESVPNATEQGRTVAAAILGRAQAFAGLPWFWSEQGSLRLQIVGLTRGHDRTIIKGDPNGGSFSVFCFRGSALLGVESMNRPADFIAARRAMTQGLAITAEEVERADFDLKSRLGPMPSAAPR